MQALQDVISEPPSVGEVRDLSELEIEHYQTDGIALIRNAISPEWVAYMRGVIEEQMARPSAFATDIKRGDQASRFFVDRYLWPTHAAFRAFAFRSGVAQLAGQAMRSRTSCLYFDQIFVKEPLTEEPFAWHQDRSYWPMGGEQICSLWTSFTDVDVSSSALEFIAGSGVRTNNFKPTLPEGVDVGITAAPGQVDMPDYERQRGKARIISFKVGAGDALLFNSRIVHSSRGNSSPTVRRIALSTRWLGDDALWRPRPGADPMITEADVAVGPGELTSGDRERFPLVWRA